MEYQDRAKIIRRIVSGTFFFCVMHGKRMFPLMGKDPTQNIIVMSDAVASSEYCNAINSGFITVQECLKTNIERGIWSDSKDKKVEEIKREIERLLKQKQQYRYRKNIINSLDSNIKKLNEQMVEIISEKESLLANTAEKYSENMADEFIITRCIFDINGNLFWGDRVKYDNGSELTLLIMQEYKKWNIVEKNVREVARTVPWRIMWASAAECRGVFNSPSSLLTSSQIELCYWSKVYDSAYNSMEPPPQSVIDNDEDFDAWMENKNNDKKEKQTVSFGGQHKQSKGTINKGKNLFTMEESFIVADKEGAKDVYNLNDDNTKNFMGRQLMYLKDNKGRGVRDVELFTKSGLKRGKNGE